jgi:NOL1/NOP2/sun family putative RNA methylase
MDLPELFEDRTRTLLGKEYDSFVAALSGDSPVSIRINPRKSTDKPAFSSVPWCENGYYLPQRPIFTMDPLFHAGSYYVQEASSMFLEQAIKQHLEEENPLVLDLCAAPGGKSTHLASLLDGKGLLISNEIIRSRAKILTENLTKWGAPNVIVTNNDPRDFSKFNGLFDLIVVDAPCSGEGMFRKDPQSVKEWSVNNVQLCSERQKRIVADVFPALKTDGLLIYSTCTYNREENEENVKWISEELGADVLPVKTDNDQNITNSGLGYRFFPHQTKGEGFFLSILRKTGNEKTFKIRLEKNQKTQKNQPLNEVKKWIVTDNYRQTVTSQTVSVVPSGYSDLIAALGKELKILQSGILLGQIKGKDILPDISLALSWIIDKQAFHIEKLTWEQAIAYLRKDTLNFHEAPQGWILMEYKNQLLGWVKNLGNRANNTYPQEWRIRMEAKR